MTNTERATCHNCNGDRFVEYDAEGNEARCHVCKGSDLLARARALASAAIDPPWTARRDQTPSGDEWVVSDGNGMWVAQCGNAPKDAAFIAAARELVPDLIAALSTERHDNAEAQRNLEAQRDAAVAELASANRRAEEVTARVLDEVLRDELIAQRDAAHAELKATRQEVYEHDIALEAVTAERDKCLDTVRAVLNACGASSDPLRAVSDLDGEARAEIGACIVDSLRAQLAAALREADRLRHGVPIEGDYVCPEAARVVGLERGLATVARDIRATAIGDIDRAEKERDAAVAELDELRATIHRIDTKLRMVLDRHGHRTDGPYENRINDLAGCLAAERDSALARVTQLESTLATYNGQSSAETVALSARIEQLESNLAGAWSEADLRFKRVERLEREKDEYARSADDWMTAHTEAEKSRDEWRERYGTDVAQLRAQLASVTAERDEARAMVGAELLGLENQVKEATRRWQTAESEKIVAWEAAHRLRDAIQAWRNWSDEVGPPFGSTSDRSDDGQRKAIAAQLVSVTAERDEARKQAWFGALERDIAVRDMIDKHVAEATEQIAAWLEAVPVGEPARACAADIASGAWRKR